MRKDFLDFKNAKPTNLGVLLVLRDMVNIEDFQATEFLLNQNSQLVTPPGWCSVPN